MFSKDELEIIKAIWGLGVKCSEEEALETYMEIVEYTNDSLY